MKFQFSLMLAGAFLLSGCGDAKKDTKQSDAPGQNPLNAPTDYLGALAKGKKKSEATVVDLQTAPAIQQFQAAEGRFPKSLQELVDQKYLRALPEAPRGMKTAYNPETGEFKIVPAK